MLTSAAATDAPGTRDWVFTVKCRTRPGEVVCLTGGCDSLGKWSSGGVARMARVDDAVDDDQSGSEEEPMVLKDVAVDLSKKGGGKPGIWSVTIKIPAGEEVLFRYCVALFVDPRVPMSHQVEGSDFSDDGTKTVIRRWETSLKPRKVSCHDAPDSAVVHEFGVAVHGGPRLVQTGWLHHDTLVEFKLYERAVHIWKRKHLGKDLFVKVTPVDVAMASQASFSMDLDESVDISETRARNKSWPLVNAASLNEQSIDNGNAHVFRPQPQFGIAYKDDGFISFQAQVMDLQSVAFLVDIFGRSRRPSPSSSESSLTSAAGATMMPHEEPAEHIGSCYLLPKNFKSTEGRMQTTIVSKRFQPIGQFSAVYLIVKPMPDFECDMRITYAQHWKAHWKGLDVGHRGLGNSYTKERHCSNIRENSIASLKNAVAAGADIVEFDVQISKDLVPVIYHNFELITSVARRKGGGTEYITLPLKSLTLSQLQALKINSTEELEVGVKDFQGSEDGDEDDDDDHAAFPTLERALKTINPHGGFNIEIKWDMELKDGSRESHHAFELNKYIDVILKTVLTYGGSRKIFFSTFNPDVCTVVRSKQNKYPVLFLTQGVNTKYEDYRDPRTWTIPMAAKFVEMAEIFGINAFSEDILRDSAQVAMVKNRGQILFVWMDEKDSEKQTVQYLKELGVDGIVYDRIDMNKESKESIFSLDHRLSQTEGENDEEERLSTCSCSTKSPGSESPKSAIEGGSVIAAEQVASVSECSPTIAEERHFKMISGTTV